MDIQALLGDEAESLLTHESKGIPKDELILPGPDFIDRVFVQTDRIAGRAAQPRPALRPRPPGRHRLPVDPAGRPGHRALGGGVVRAQPDVLRPGQHREAGHRGRVQRRGHHVRRARRREPAATPTASRSSSSSTTTSCSPTRTSSTRSCSASSSRPGTWAPSASAPRSTSAPRSRTRQLQEVAEAFAEAHAARHVHRAVVLPAQQRLQEGRRRLQRRPPTSPARPTTSASPSRPTSSSRSCRRTTAATWRSDYGKTLAAGLRPAHHRPPDRPDPLAGGQLLHGPHRAHQLRRRVEGRRRPGRGGAHRRHQQAGRRPGPDLGPQGVPAADGRGHRAAPRHPGRLPRRRHHASPRQAGSGPDSRSRPFTGCS